jgi:hypothetical protein
MSEDLLRKLQFLEDDYVGQPLIAQRADLREINEIRSQLGMPLVDAHLHEIGVAPAREEVKKPEPEEAQDHSEAREIFQAYQKKIAALEVHRAYAEQVAEATAGQGQTPVRPLATLGTHGGPLLCDHCGKPIVLEGGRFHGVAADAAWKENPTENWVSWVLGGMVVEIQTNGTLRIYYGYPGRKNDCCEVAIQEFKKVEAKFESGKGSEKEDMLRAFLEQEFPDMTSEELLDLLRRILQTMYSFDPGIGINRPSRES